MNGMGLIEAERARQQAPREEGGEGFDSRHDAGRWLRDLVKAGEAYEAAKDDSAELPASWPFAPEMWKPKTRLKNLVRAGALYLAAADRMELQHPGQEYAANLRLRAARLGDVIGNL